MRTSVAGVTAIGTKESAASRALSVKPRAHNHLGQLLRAFVAQIL